MSTPENNPEQIQDDILAILRTAFAADKISYPTAADLARFSKHDQAFVDEALRDLAQAGKITLDQVDMGPQRVTAVTP